MDIVVPEEYKHLYVTDAKRPIVKIPAQVLRQKAHDVEKIGRKHAQLVSQMIRLMRQANGVGLAAPQIGIGQRVIVMAPEGMRPLGMINPRITKMDGEQVGQEGCLSIPGLYGDVKRAQYVEVEAFDAKGDQFIYELEGMPARVVQHEIDHLDGVLFIDKVDPTTLHWQDPRGPDEDE